MSDPEKEPRSEADERLEREVREGRKFNLAEAIGRLAGPGSMKGASPIPRGDQAGIEIEQFLSSRLSDPTGNLRSVLLRDVKGSDLLFGEYEQPLAVLRAYVRRLLGSEPRLKALVREVDVDWGRDSGERPQFEREGEAPSSDDPYTIESVRAALARLVEEPIPGT